MTEVDPNAQPLDGDPKLTAADDADIVAEVDDLVKPEAEKNRDAIKNALIATKRELRASNRRVKELEPVAQQVAQINERLEHAKPYIDALVMNPALKAEALRIANGGAATRTSGFGTAQPAADEDPDAAAIADLNGYFLADGQPDLARARRALDIMDRRSGRQADEKMRPLAGSVLGSRAEENVRYAMSLTDDDGAPMATRQSIEETVKMLGGPASPMLADPQVVNILINNAIGLDKRNKRTPKAPEEPLYLERQTNGGRREPLIDADLKKTLDRLNLSEKEFTESNTKLNTAVATRRGIRLE